MSNFNSSANMSLPIPVSGVDPGPDWSLNLNSCLTILDGHDHSPGKGVQINPSGLNINSDLTFLQNNAVSLRSARFTPQNSVLGGSSDLGCLYEVGVDLYFNDGNGNNVRITQSGGVAGSPGSISNLNSPASASYVSADSTFVWQSDANTPANLDAASVILRNLTASSNGLTLAPPAAMGSNFSITLPTLPASQKFLTIDNTGAMAASWAVDGSTIIVSSNTVLVPTGGITTTQIASATIVSGNIASATIVSGNIASKTIVAGNIADGTITTTQIASGTILNANISASAGITGSKLVSGIDLPGVAKTNARSIAVRGASPSVTPTITTMIYSGIINPNSGSPTILSGEGFTVSFVSGSVYQIDYSNSFSIFTEPPVVITTDAGGSASYVSGGSTQFRFSITGTPSRVNFIVIGDVG